jgi:hypothetical protein
MLWLIPIACSATTSLAAQEFLPPAVEEERGPFWLGLAGFATRFGVDFSGDEQPVLGVSLDIGDLGTPRLRLRPSFEVGFGSGFDTYVANLETLYRFVGDEETAVPYLGAGLGLYSQEECDLAESCPELWLQVALGFELRMRDNMNWFIEFHAEDAFSRQRIFIGLTTRRTR